MSVRGAKKAPRKRVAPIFSPPPRPETHQLSYLDCFQVLFNSEAFKKNKKDVIIYRFKVIYEREKIAICSYL